MATHFDVIISGGGLSGLLTAVGLMNETPKLSIAIIEPQAKTQQHELGANFDGRCLALSHGSIELLKHWQVWPELQRVCWPIKTIVTSDRGHIGKTIMKAEEYSVSAMGHVVEMRNLGAVFQNTLKQLKPAFSGNIEWFEDVKIEHVAQQPDSVDVRLSTEQILSAKLLVVAEGGNSATRKLLNIETSQDDYPQSAIVANIKVKGAEQKLNRLLARARNDDTLDSDVAHHVAFERFTTHGPIALLPIAKQQYALVWTDTPENIQAYLKLNKDEFCRAFQKAFGFAAGQITAVSDVASYPLSLIKAKQMFNGRCVLVGNAAHTVHPIAGQGFNLGLRDIAVLVKLIADRYIEDKSDIGDFSLFNNYAKNRQQDIERITGFTDLLVRGFGLEGRLPALSRTLGLLALQKSDSLQQWLALHFMSSKSLKDIPALNE